MLGVTPEITNAPGTSKIHHGSCQSAGYWCGVFRAEYPDRPTIAFEWTENLAATRESDLEHLLRDGFSINVYIAIHTNVMTTGFDLPPMPKLWKLGIPIGVEFFSQ